MSAITRRERQRIANREGILQAALGIARREGWAAVTIRKIADEIEYTSPIIYQHFDNKEAALQALMERGYGQLAEAMRHPAAATTPDEQLLDIGRAYLRFARDQPELYQLMSGLSGVSLDGGVRQTAAAGVVKFTTEAIQAWADQKRVRLADPMAASETAWGILHGMVSIGMLPDIGFEHAEQLAVDALSAVMKSWEARP